MRSGNRIAKRRRRRERSKRKVGGKRNAFVLPDDLPAGKPRFVAPMKPKMVDKPPADGDWLYELKFDGIRLIAVKDGAKVNLISRNENELASRFPEIAAAIAALTGA